MSEQQTQQGKSAGTSILQRSSSGLLQRKCDTCGQHTIAGGTCSSCEKEKTWPLQRKLMIGASNDPLELEADRVAEQVMSMALPATPNIQQQAEEEQEEVQAKPLVETTTPIVPRQETLEVEDLTQAKCEACEEEEHVQRSPNGVPQVQADLENRLNASKGGGSPLSDEVRSFMEPRFKANFRQVRVHTGSAAIQMSRDLGAKAFTHKQEIYYGVGTSPSRDALTAHELTHVVQQSGKIPFSDASQNATNQATQISARTMPDIIQRDVLPLAKFSPAPGLFVDRTENSVTISGAMELHGSEANASRAASVQTSINTTWTRTFPDGYSVSCNITVTYRGKGSSPGNATQIEAAKISGPSFQSRGLRGRFLTLNANDSDAFTWVPAHEFGHIIGLNDRYSEGIMSTIKGSFGGERTTSVQAGYEGNLMAERAGALESKNVKDIAEENEPSSYWIYDDDQVRDWVNGHSLSDIGKLSTNNKLKAIKTLMSGWISDDDVAAIAQICSSVTSSAEANIIRSGVNLLDMTSIGQRTMVRVTFSKMP